MPVDARHRINMTPTIKDLSFGQDDVELVVVVSHNAAQPDSKKQREKTLKSPWTKDQKNGN